MRMPAPALALCLALALPAHAAEYFSAPEDLPLMPGMAEAQEQAVVFDAPQGRIINAAGDTVAAPADISAFYAQTLPALGWKPAGENTWRRGDETLSITFEKAPAGTRARFSLVPRENAAP